MTKHTMGGAALPRIAGDDSSTDKEIELRRGLIRRDGQIQEAAALLLLLGNELVRHNQGEHGDWSDKGFGEFIACGLVGVTHKAAQNLYQSTRDDASRI